MNVCKGCKLLNPLEEYNLKRYCESHGLDPQLIDNNLSYSENMEVLKDYAVDEIGELDEQEINAAYDWYDSQTYEDRYGEIPKGEIPPQFQRTIINFKSRRRQVRFPRTKGQYTNPLRILQRRNLPLQPLHDFIMDIVPNPKVIELILGSYITIMGTPEDVSECRLTLEKYGYVRHVNTNHVYDHRVQHIPNKGWTLKPEEPQPTLTVVGGTFHITP